MHTQQQFQNEGKRYVYFFFTYNGPNNRISQLFNLLAGSQIPQIIHFDIEIAKSEQTNKKNSCSHKCHI